MSPTAEATRRQYSTSAVERLVARMRRSISTPSIRSSNCARGRLNSRMNGCSADALRTFAAFRRTRRPARRATFATCAAAFVARLRRQPARPLVSPAHLVHGIVNGAAEVPDRDDRAALAAAAERETNSRSWCRGSCRGCARPNGLGHPMAIATATEASAAPRDGRWRITSKLDRFEPVEDARAAEPRRAKLVAQPAAEPRRRRRGRRRTARAFARRRDAALRAMSGATSSPARSRSRSRRAPASPRAAGRGGRGRNRSQGPARSS